MERVGAVETSPVTAVAVASVLKYSSVMRKYNVQYMHQSLAINSVIKLICCNNCVLCSLTCFLVCICVEILRPSQHKAVMSSSASLPNDICTGQSSRRVTSTVHILSPGTDNCPSWISGRKRMILENISWSIFTKECCRPGVWGRGSNLQTPGAHSCLSYMFVVYYVTCHFIFFNQTLCILIGE